MNQSTIVKISAGFWKYHKTILGEIGQWQVLKQNATTVTVELDDVALTELKFSAKRVIDPSFTDMSDPEMRAESRRATRVLTAIAKAEGGN